MKYLISESKKNRRRKFWIYVLLLFSVAILWSLFSTQIQFGKNPDSTGSFILFNMITANNLIIPFLIALMSSRLVSAEKDNNMIKSLMLSNESQWQLFFSKWLVIIITIIIAAIVELVLCVSMSLIMNHRFNIIELIYFLLDIVIASSVITSIHLLLSFKMKNQSIPISIGLAGSFISLVTSGFLPKWITLFIPWQYISFLNPYKLLKGEITVIDNWPLLMLTICLISSALIVFIRRQMNNSWEILS